MKVLFIGNSFTGRNDLPGLIACMAAGAKPPVHMETESLLVNGASLRLHWNAGKALRRIEEENWDYVVLQEQSTLPIKNAKRFHENVRLFDEAIRTHGARTVLYLTWARRDSAEAQSALNEATAAIAREIGALVAPVGIAWQAVRSAHPQIEIYDKDGSHPSLAGSYLAACVFHHVLLGAEVPRAPLPDKPAPAEARILRSFAAHNSL